MITTADGRTYDEKAMDSKVNRYRELIHRTLKNAATYDPQAQHLVRIEGEIANTEPLTAEELAQKHTVNLAECKQYLMDGLETLLEIDFYVERRSTPSRRAADVAEETAR